MLEETKEDSVPPEERYQGEVTKLKNVLEQWILGERFKGDNFEAQSQTPEISVDEDGLIKFSLRITEIIGDRDASMCETTFAYNPEKGSLELILLREIWKHMNMFLMK